MTLPQGGMADAWAGAFGAQPTGSDPGETVRRLTGHRTEAELARDQIDADRRDDERRRERYRAGTDAARRRLAGIAAELATAEEAISAATEGLREGRGSTRVHVTALYRAQAAARTARDRLDAIAAEEAAAWEGMDATVRYGVTRAKFDVLAPHRTAGQLIEAVDKAEPDIDRAERRERRTAGAESARRAELAQAYPSLRTDRPGMGDGPSVPVTRARGEFDTP